MTSEQRARLNDVRKNWQGTGDDRHFLLSLLDSQEAELTTQRKQIEVMRAAIQVVLDSSPKDSETGACWFCDMGGSGHSSKGDNHHDDSKKYYCAIHLCEKAVKLSDTEKGEVEK